jgi:hypothetical protein
MQTEYFKVTKEEYCHISDEAIFLTGDEIINHMPKPHDLGEGWGVKSIVNYLLVFLLGMYILLSVGLYGLAFFIAPVSYGAMFLFVLLAYKAKDRFNKSMSPYIYRNTIKSAEIKSQLFAAPSLEIYFDGPEGKVLRRNFPILYKNNALKVLENSGILK